MTTIEKIRAEIANLTCDCISGMVNQYAVLQIIDKYAEQEPCDDAISRQATLEPYKVLNDTDTLCVALIRANIMQQPSVRPQEPKTGHWIIDKGSLDAFYGEVCKCSECGVESIGESDFCPYCGAKMVEPQESEDKE